LGVSETEWFNLLSVVPKSRISVPFLEEWTNRDRAAALAAVKSLPDQKNREAAIHTVLLEWSRQDAFGAIEKYRQSQVNDSDLLSNMLVAAIRQDRKKAIELLAGLDPVEFAVNAPNVVDLWSKSDPLAAMEWGRDHGVSYSPNKALTAEPGKAIAWIRSQPAGRERDRLYLLAIPNDKVDSATALTLFGELSPDLQPIAAGTIVAKLRYGELFQIPPLSFPGVPAAKSQNSPEAAAAWARTLPPGQARAAAWKALWNVSPETVNVPTGPDRDAMLLGAVCSTGEGILPNFNLILQIQDASTRRLAFDRTMEFATSYTSPNSAAPARESMEKAAVPEEWKQRWRQTDP
jgi:hypothetical protein